MTTTAPQIGELLVSRGLLTASELDALLVAQATSGKRLLSHLLETGRAGERELVEVLTQHLGERSVALRSSVVRLEDLELVPRQVALADLVLPLRVEGGRLHVAVVDPSSETLEELRFATLLDVVPYCALESVLRQTIAAAWEARARGAFELRGADAAEGASGLDVAHPELELEVASDGDTDFDEVLASVQVPGSPRPRILVVDDEPEICELTSLFLGSHGYLTASAVDAPAALREFVRFQPNLVLLDAMLPGMHGFDLCVKLKREHPRLPVVMMSAAYRGWRFAEDARESLGADDYLEKPFHLEELLRKLEQHLPPDDTSDHRARALVLYRRGLELSGARDFPGAVAAFREAVMQDPQSSRAHYQLARALQEPHEAFSAMHHFERAIDLQPAMLPASRSLAALYLSRGFRRKATEVLERALRTAADAPTRKAVQDDLLRLLDGAREPLLSWPVERHAPLAARH